MNYSFAAVYEWVNGPGWRKPPPPRPCADCGQPVKGHGKDTTRCAPCFSKSQRHDWTIPRTCTKCRVVKPPEEFYERGRRRYSWCRWCHYAATHRHVIANPETAAEVNRTWARSRRLYLTVEQVRAMDLDYTTCGVCGREPLRTKAGRLQAHAVDHDHVTGRIRGILCSPCNKAIGFAGDDPARLRALADYLDRHAEAEVGKA